MRSLVVVMAIAAPASADPVARAVSVRATLEGATATFAVRYAVRVEGPAVGEATVAIPATAVATRATAIVGGVARPLALVGAARAQDEMEALQGVEAGPRPRWGIAIVDGGGRELAISIAAPVTTELAIELELSAHTCFERDVRYVPVLAAWRDLLPRALRARAPAAACADAADQDTLWVGFPARELAQREPGAARVSAFAGQVALGDAQIARVELAIAGRLGEVPRDLATAIVVDGSRSLRPAEIEAQRELVAAYLRAAPGGRVQLIAYARDARALLPSWTAASLAATRVDRELRALAPRNGSNVDAGLAEAGRWLARVGGTHRVVVLTDDRLARRLKEMPAAALQRLVPGALIHVVVPLDDASEPARDDSATLGALARATEGFAIATGIPKGGLDATLLVRPTTLDSVEVTAPGWTQLRVEPACGNVLAEGAACTWWGEGGPIAGPIAISGLAWGKRVSRVMRPDPRRGPAVARELAGLALLDDEAQTRAEAAARAVNRSWSLFAAWGGADGYGMIIGRSFRHHCCDGTPTGFGSFSGTISERPPLPPLDLAPQLGTSVARCALAGRVVRADIETTLSEIVDVRVAVAPYDRALATCVEDAIWDTPLQVPPRYPTTVSHVVF